MTAESGNRVHIERASVVRMALPAAEAFPLFNAEGERRWVAGWVPCYLHRAGSGVGEGVVFQTTRKGVGTATWTQTRHDPASGAASFVFVYPDHHTAIVDVGVTADGNARSRASVRYRMTSLSPDADDYVRAFGEAFDSYMGHWEEAIQRHVVEGVPLPGIQRGQSPLQLRSSHPLTIADLADQPSAIRRQAAVLLVEGFDRPKGWPDLHAATRELDHVLASGFAFAAVEDDLLLGWIGGLPQYDGRVWELHPLVVRPDRRLRGIGRALVTAFEDEAGRRGACTLTLGTDDDSSQTSLAGVDLYSDIPRHIAELRDLGDRHPFLFYRRLGYVVTGVMPDANGSGKPDIYMSRAVRREE
ncbi:MAG: GNAT family N-acetyltransferase [Gemmatimonadota bacterium]|nr:GNAT family N-acetyltransferase [Gemmatimonadota bacterium]MDE2865946.1 GNAT family N-acetyltransferase [Gemmatimonadota bacterium]